MAKLLASVVEIARSTLGVLGLPVPDIARRFHRVLFRAVTQWGERPPLGEFARRTPVAWQRAVETYTERVLQDPIKPLWIVTALPPDKSGVAIYTQRALANSAGPVVFFAPVRTESQLKAARSSLERYLDGIVQHARGAEILPLRTLADARRALPEQPVLYVLGNSEHHVGTLLHLLRFGAASRDVVHLHDVYLGDLLALYFGTYDRLNQALLDAYPADQVDQWFHRRTADPETTDGPNGPRVLISKGVRHFVVNSAAAADRLRADLGADTEGVQIDTLFLTVLPREPRTYNRDSAVLRIAHFGLLHPSKQPERLIAACDLLASRRPIELVLAGYKVQHYVRSHGLERDYVSVVESPSDEALEETMGSIDCAVQLRFPDHGESSGVVNQLLALRRSVVCTRVGSFAELDGAVHLVPPDVGPSELARAIEEAARTGWTALAEELIAARSPQVFEAGLRSLLGLASVADTPSPIGPIEPDGSVL